MSSVFHSILIRLFFVYSEFQFLNALLETELKVSLEGLIKYLKSYYRHSFKLQSLHF